LKPDQQKITPNNPSKQRNDPSDMSGSSQKTDKVQIQEFQNERANGDFGAGIAYDDR